LARWANTVISNTAPVPGTVEIESQHEVGPSAAVHGTDMKFVVFYSLS